MMSGCKSSHVLAAKRRLSSHRGTGPGRVTRTTSSVAVLACVSASALAGLAACSSGASTATYTKIDDMEGSSGVIELPSPDGTTPGAWDTSVIAADPAGAQCHSVLPAPRPAGGTWSYEPVPVPYQTLPAITSLDATRFRTTAPLVNVFGAAIGFDLADLPSPPQDGGAPTGTPACPPTPTPPARAVDLRAYRGITFWGMASAQGGATSKVFLGINDENSDPRGDRCDPSAASNPRTACFNSFAFPVELSSTFTQHTIYFSQFKQAAFGYRATPSVLNLQKVYGLSFTVQTPGFFCPPPNVCAGAPPTLTFDIWIDDLYFVNE
jgi:hypothetical protein